MKKLGVLNSLITCLTKVSKFMSSGVSNQILIGLNRDYGVGFGF